MWKWTNTGGKERGATSSYVLLSLRGRTEKTHVIMLCYLVYILKGNWTEASINQPFKLHDAFYARGRM